MPELAEGFEATWSCGSTSRSSTPTVADGRFEIGRGEATAPDVTIETDPGTLIALVHGRRPLDEALRAGDVAITGDQRAAKRFLGLFPLPEPAAAAASADRKEPGSPGAKSPADGRRHSNAGAGSSPGPVAPCAGTEWDEWR